MPNANWAGYGQRRLSRRAAAPGALWIREVLDVGWGDTYAQYIAGQAFDITDLPNGDVLRPRPTSTRSDRCSSRTTDNNVEDRLVKLRGTPGHRRVVVPPWHGIDTENSCSYCG